MNEGLRIARDSAARLLQGVDAKAGRAPLTEALQSLGLRQRIFAQQLELPFPEVANSVRGILDAPEKAVYIIEKTIARQRWISAHEIGHYAIVEHEEIFRTCNQWDLAQSARQILEREANEFAASFLFQGRSFVEECLQMRFSLDMLRDQAERWGVSYESAFRRFAEQHPDPVALAVCEPIKPAASAPPARDSSGHLVVDFSVLDAGQRGARLKYWVGSRSYWATFPRLESKQEFPPDHFICRAMSYLNQDNYGVASIDPGNVTLPVSVFFNGYDALVLLGIAAKEVLAASA